jgi:hypothetical protein
MRRNIFLLIILLFSTTVALSQNKEEKNPWFISKDNMSGTKFFYELSGGLSYPNMVFSTTNYGNSNRKSLFLPDVGLSARIQLKKWFSLAPRLSYAENGLSYADEVNYLFKSNYLKFSMPVDFQFALGKRNQIGTTKFFIYAGPYIALPLSGKISTDDFLLKLKMADMNNPDYGVNAGLGFRIPTFSLEGRSFLTLRVEYSRGLADTYSKGELALSEAVSDRLYLDSGKRYNSGIRLVVGVEMPKKNKRIISFTAGGDGKKNYKKIVIIDEK